ncbi:hypothetical protein J4221_04995, partial [Candidatus Pacearchaeota archaeon]|nr:hypothetical protein [Candidatus Pacearchaeota archaeon]
CITVLILFFLFFVSSQSISVNIRDNYNFDDSSNEDHVIFEGYSFSIQAKDIDYSLDPDLVCFNWDKFGGTNSYSDNIGFYMDKCTYDSSTSRDQCISLWDINLSTSNMTIDFETIFLNPIITFNDHGDFVQAQLYDDCDSSSAPSANLAFDQFYSVIEKRQYYCPREGDDSFYVRGRYYDRQTGRSKWINYDSKSCSFIYNTYYGCAINRDEIDDITGRTILSDPCAIKDSNEEGNACKTDSECISQNCDGERLEFTFNCGDGSDNYNSLSSIYRNSCGGGGWLDLSLSESLTCSSQLGNDNYVCDADLTPIARQVDGVLIDPREFCRLKEYVSCTNSSECWNNNGGYNCIGTSGNKICTTGDNGKTCFNNNDLQCDSLRCDSTCQARLNDGLACDENSDCINGMCSGGICGGAGVSTDLAVVDIIPVQVIKDVDLVKGKRGIIRVVVTNYGLNNASGRVNITFDGVQLNVSSGENQTKSVHPGTNVSFDFDFVPLNTGSRTIIANVSVV